MNGITQILYVSEERGDDELGDGSIECPFYTVDRAIEVDDRAAIFVNDVYTAPAPLDFEPDEFDSSYTPNPMPFHGLVIGGCLMTMIVGAVVHQPIVAVASAALVALALIQAGRNV